MPGLDYFTISRLRGQELFDYISRLEEKKNLELGLRKWNFKSFFRNFDISFLVVIFILATGGISFYLGKYYLGAFFSMFFVFYLVFYFVVLSRLNYYRGLFFGLSEPVFKVVKGREILFVPRSRVNVGDVILIEEGMRVPFDVRLLESRNLVVDETLVFGEGEKVNKHAGTLSGKEFKLYELGNIVFKNSIVVRGSGKGIVFSVPGEHEGLSKVEKIFFRGKRRVFYVIFCSLFSFILAVLAFLVSRDVILMLGVFLVSLAFLVPQKIEKLLLIKSFEFMYDFVSKGIIVGNPFLLFHLSKASKIFVNLKHSSFENTKVKVFIPKGSVYLDYESFREQRNLPYEYLIYTYFLVSFLYAKQKEVANKVYLTSCVNFFRAFVPEECLSSRVFSVLDYGVSDGLFDGRSFVEVSYEGRSFRLEAIPLKGYFSEFGDIPGLRYENKDGIVVLKVEGEEIEIISVLLFDKVKIDLIELMSNLEPLSKVYFTSSFSRKELKKFFESIYVDFESLASVDVKEMESWTQEEMRFYLEKFNIFCKVSHDFLGKFFPIFVKKEYNTFVFAFYDSPYGKVEISSLPNISRNMNNTVFTIGENLVLPLIAVELSRKIVDSLERLGRVLVFIPCFFSFSVFACMLVLPIFAFLIVFLVGVFYFFFVFSLGRVNHVGKTSVSG